MESSGARGGDVGGVEGVHGPYFWFGISLLIGALLLVAYFGYRAFVNLTDSQKALKSRLNALMSLFRGESEPEPTHGGRAPRAEEHYIEEVDEDEDEDEDDEAEAEREGEGEAEAKRVTFEDKKEQ